MRRLTEPEKEKIIELYNLGKMDTEIGKELGVSDGTIFSFRIFVIQFKIVLYFSNMLNC